MININNIKAQAYLKIAKRSKRIAHISKFYYTKLRYIYQDKIPASLYLLLMNNQEHSALNCLLFTKTLPENDKSSIVIAKSTLLKRHIYIESEFEIIDPMLGIIVDKDYYDALLGIHDKKYISRNKILDIVKKNNIGNDTIYDCMDVDRNKLIDFKIKANKLSKGKQKLVNEQIDSFVDDINSINYIKVK